MTFDIERIKREVSLIDIAGEVLKLERRGKEYVALCCFHTDMRASLTLFRGRGATTWNRYQCFPCGANGDVIDFVKKYYDKNTRDALAFLVGRIGIAPTRSQSIPVRETTRTSTRPSQKASVHKRDETPEREVERYSIPRELMGGELVEQIRFEPKGFRWSRNGRWSLKGEYQVPPVEGELDPKTLPLYLSWHLRPDETIVICEGPKAAIAARHMGLNAVGCYGVANLPAVSALGLYRRREVVAWPDADELGREFMVKLANRLKGIAAECWVVEWAEAGPKEDAADFLERYGADAAKLAQRLIEPQRQPA